MTELNAGSLWHRWEPHVHAPGTLFNDQYGGPDPWETFLNKVETATPTIRAVGLTDYYLTHTYERMRAAKAAGRLPKVEVLFPNIELRLNVGTVKNRWVNVHLLVSPEDPDHVNEVQRFLARLQFEAYEDVFSCTADDLTKLGRAANPALTAPEAALQHGAGQFKVGFDALRAEYSKSAWAKENILVAVAGGQTDGTSGVREAADATLREEMERFAHIIFASSAAQREFWLGLRIATPDQIRARFGGLKPCLHGSDAHDSDRVGAPTDDRLSWVKGGIEFDALRQACIDPMGRAYVGEKPPENGAQSRLMKSVEINGASWAATPALGLNPGLVAIIGARGSGKTALADIIAAACDAVHYTPGDRRPSSSFLMRAAELLGGASATVQWRDGDVVSRALDGSDKPDPNYPRVRYLSQQFVEDLCSASGMTDELLQEIERVIFESHSSMERDGALDFDELLDLRASRHRLAREREADAILQLSESIGAELEKDRLVSDLISQAAQKTKEIESYTKDRAKLVAKGSEERVRRLTELTAAAEKIKARLRLLSTQEQALLGLRDEVSDLRRNKAPDTLRRTKERHAATRLNSTEWQPFLLDYSGDVDQQISAALTAAQKAAADWRGRPPQAPVDPERAYLSAEADLDRTPLALLQAETTRLQALVSADVVTQKRFAALSERIAQETAALSTLSEKLDDAKGAKERAKALQREREAAYTRVFEAIVAEEEVLGELYKPLMDRIATSSGTLGKLTFTVSRTADVARWASYAEQALLDLRRQGPFRGRGSLQGIAEANLQQEWETGSPESISSAMLKFRDEFHGILLAHATVSIADANEYRGWLKQFAQWLYSSDHVQLNYGILYDGVDIRKLSPGTRGIVLLLLYLALDDEDDRPLIIDQPEENLDPKSVFDELVGLFIEAKQRRQIIIVTHNANLVINTDADQVIVASAGPHRRGTLPEISYRSGGMENREIRALLCDILEGGEDAFKERARRLRVGLNR